ncbi:hypothetical protein [Crocinitomix algicola]|uniref:hypothetical protein n=1 Tax=Crocinitomix algicola TaxID=1740263 RepID=UPI0008344D7B|nr:hypothetical protein [Crocinitomix algicola]
MKYSFLLISLNFVFYTYSQDSLQIRKCEIVEIFKRINKTDKSNIKDTTIRYQSFQDNFNQIVSLIESGGLIDASSFSKKERKIISQGITRTFIHIFQINADLILNEHFIHLIANELKAGRFSREYLVVPLSIYVYDNNIKSPFTGVLKEALIKWEISDKEILR